MRATVLIVDDESDIRELLSITLLRMGYESYTAATVEEAKQLIAQQTIHLCLCDMRLPDGNGIEFVQHISEHFAHVPVAIITAHGNMSSAIDALKAGAFDFISKPVDLKQLRTLIETALKLEQRPDRTANKPVQRRFKLIGQSPCMDQLRQKIAKLARSQTPVWITGESGTGKELVARILHEEGARQSAPFVPVNCGAIPNELMESEFFGHRKGSFTGAIEDKLGLFRSAEGGTLFLDEVADLPLSMQVKLLRAIQEKSVRPVGAHSEEVIDVRILSASHKNLAVEVQEGRFREDLYYRLNVIELRVPSLRERPADIPVLAEFILQKLAQGDHPALQLSEGARNALMQHPFPGNVRELENILERALALSETAEITEDDLHLPQAIPITTTQTETPMMPRPAALDEKMAVTAALEQVRWNKTAAAKLLGLTYRQLRYKVKKYGLE